MMRHQAVTDRIQDRLVKICKIAADDTIEHKLAELAKFRDPLEVGAVTFRKIEVGIHGVTDELRLRDLAGSRAVTDFLPGFRRERYRPLWELL